MEVRCRLCRCLHNYVCKCAPVLVDGACYIQCTHHMHQRPGLSGISFKNYQTSPARRLSVMLRGRPGASALMKLDCVSGILAKSQIMESTTTTTALLTTCTEQISRSSHRRGCRWMVRWTAVLLRRFPVQLHRKQPALVGPGPVVHFYLMRFAQSLIVGVQIMATAHS